ncbi:phosphoinositide-3-kinase-interacting protein 1 isoform X1 [Microcaecilia unicolor]|uniref:Phosphoinositide-3-kinase-interacting protein 1 isoform X1 n=2 Tax=Microcaecilia unicolor TaxID=1415580 RepID=A0A6P7ZNL8_9AMPH|nr:phosphoinositide-3-kinase-interacting protein 1 isoform X1 [Microcaecilia unicolor]
MWAGVWYPTYLLLVASACVQGEECLRGNGAQYRGNQQMTAAGTQCLNWLQVSRDLPSVLPAVLENHSYCRNPDNDGHPWCYVSGEGGVPQKQHCTIQPCEVPVTSTTQMDNFTHLREEEKQVFEPADSFPVRSESAAVQPVVGINQRMRVNSKEKKDLGILGYVLGVLMMVVIIAIGSGVVIGYMYKRGKALKQQHEARVYERELQRITLPLSAFSNPTCDTVDENAVVVHPIQSPVDETLQEGDAPLMGQAGTPGA